MADGTDEDGAGPRERAPDDGIELRLAKVLLPGFIRRRYAAKFLLTLLVVTAVVAALGAFTYVEVRDITQDDAETTLQSTATLQADNVAEWLSSMRSQALAAGSADSYATGDTDRIRTLLSDIRARASEDVVGLHYVDGTGTITASTDTTIEGQRPEDVSPGLSNPVDIVTAGPDAQRVAISTAFERRGRMLMAFASRVHGGDGAVVVVANVGEDVEQLHRERTVVTTRILDADGRGVLAPRSDRVSEVVETPEFRAALNGSTTLIEGDSEVIALAPIPGTEWVVRTVAPTDALYAASESVSRNVVVLVVATLLTVIVIAGVLGRQTVLPLVRLRKRTEEMAEGDLNVGLHSAREDEIGQLYASLARMRDALRDQIREAEAARDDAERARAELERQNERLEAFASTVSHDLRNPLTVARGNVELLRADAEAGETGDIASEVEATADALDRMEAIIDDVLELARRGATLDETEPVELEDVARRAWGSVETGNATLTVADTRTIEADQDRLRRALENLFRNAVEHGSTSPASHPQQDAIEHAGPDVTVEVGLTDEGFYVADDGPGIPPDQQEQVFEYGHTTAADGTGLGLSIVATIAEAHGWSVAVENDDGARFLFDGVLERDIKE